MVLFGDSIHNFADGLAIGAAFNEDLILGITTTIAVACHELPHELGKWLRNLRIFRICFYTGDYAVLLQSGFSHSRALLWNFLSATTAIIGFFIGSFMSDNEDTRQWIFAATIGMFLYIALADLVWFDWNLKNVYSFSFSYQHYYLMKKLNSNSFLLLTLAFFLA